MVSFILRSLYSTLVVFVHDISLGELSVEQETKNVNVFASKMVVCMFKDDTHSCV